MRYRNPILASTIAALLSGGMVATESSHADETAAELERVTVTGTRVGRLDIETMSPTSVISREDMEAEGISTAFDLLSRIPSASTGSFSEAGNEADSTSPGTAGIGLRELNANATLVLINGRRIANSPMAESISINFADLNSIPVSAMERVEILKDGASAVYGTDAIAGVVNIITRTDEDGLTVGADYGISAEGDAEESRVYAHWGAEGERMRTTTGVEFSYRDALRMVDRDFSESANKTDIGGYDFRSSLGSNPGAYFLQDSEEWVADPECPDDRTVVQGEGLEFCVFDFAPDMINRPDEQRASGFTFSEFDLGDGHVLYSEIMAHQRSSEITGAATPTVGDLTIDEDNDMNPFDEDVTVRYRYTDAGPRVQDNQHTSLRTVIGGTGPFIGTWNYDTSFTFQRHSAWQRGVSGFINQDRAQQAFDEEIYNPFLPLGEDNDQEALDLVQTTTNRTAVSSLQMGEFGIDGEFGDLIGGAIGAATGIQYREERIRDTPDEQFQRGQIIGTEATHASGQRDVTSAYGELVLPVHYDVDVQLALRHDDYSDFGSTTNPKLGLSWRPMDELMFRASYSEGFRAPSIAEIGLLPTEESPILFDPENPDQPPTERIVQFEGNPDLEPETSESFIFGIIAEPYEWLSVSLDYWRIQHEDLIDSDPQFVVDRAAAGDPEFEDMVERDGAGQIVSVQDTFRNLGEQNVEGIDLDLQASFEGLGGQFLWNTEFTYLDRFDRRLRPDVAEENWAGTFQRPRLRAYSRLSWSTEDWGWHAGLRHVGSYSEVNNDFGLDQGPAGQPISDVEVSSWNPIDVGAHYQVTDGGQAYIHVDNLFDEDPPFVATSVWGFDTRNHDPRGTFIRMGYQHEF